MNEPTELNMLEAALYYASIGVRIFPGRPRREGGLGAKSPRISEWQHKATTDAAQITEWWTRWPDSVICAPTGAANGFSVIDVDMKHGKDGFASMRGLEERCGETTRKLIAQTPSGGFHIFYRHRDGIRNSSDQVASGIDVRGDGGYVVLTPSRIDEGDYTWYIVPELGLGLADVLDDMPDEWFQAITASKDKAKQEGPLLDLSSTANVATSETSAAQLCIGAGD